VEGRYTFEECFLDGDGAWQAVPDGRGTGESDIADEANELSGLCAGGATPAVWIWQFNDDAGYRRYVFEAAEGGLRWGFAAAAWESGNTVTITPCVGAEDNTPTGQDDVTGYLTLPVGGAPDESLTPVIEEGDILGYLRFGEDEGLLPGIKWAAAAGGEGGEGLSVSAWVDVDGEGSKIRTISTADWRSRMVVYHIAWGQEPLQGGEFPNSETGQRVIYTADSTQPYVFTKSAGNDAVAAFIDGTDGGKLKLEIDKGNPQSTCTCSTG
jgi:hypothetical protein